MPALTPGVSTQAVLKRWVAPGALKVHLGGAARKSQHIQMPKQRINFLSRLQLTYKSKS